jgi:hypothetical protein
MKNCIYFSKFEIQENEFMIFNQFYGYEIEITSTYLNKK